VGAADGLHDYQSVMRISGVMLLLMLVVGVVGAVITAGRERWGMVLTLGIGLELLLVPTLTHAEWGYAVPAEGPIAVAAAAGFLAIGRRFAQRRPIRTTVTPSRSET
jgi:hypothetical protein